MRHVLTLRNLKSGEIEVVFLLAKDLKAKWRKGIREPLLPGRVLALLLDDISLRTRVSFDAAITQLGGRAITLGTEAGFRTRESNADFCRVLGQFVDVVVMRTARHESLAELAALCACAVINGRSDIAHPSQALADLFSAVEALGDLDGRTLAYLGPSGGLARSLAVGCARLGMRFVMAAPKCYQLEESFVTFLRHETPGAQIELTTDPDEAVGEAGVVYAGHWNSTHLPVRGAGARVDVSDYLVTPQLLARAPSKALRMHSLRLDRQPALSGEVFDHPQSLVSAQIANRLHVQKGLLLWLLGSRGNDATAASNGVPAKAELSARGCG